MIRAALVAGALTACPVAAQTPAGPPGTPPPTAVGQGWTDTWLPRPSGDIQALDKVSARATKLTLRVGQTASNETLSITLRACVVRPPDQPQDSAAYFDIVDSRPGASAFHGWMFANEPHLAMFEHPVYDVRIAACH